MVRNADAQAVVEARRRDVDDLSFAALQNSDLLNLILQRSECLYDVPRAGRPVRAWVRGNPEPLQSLVADMGTEIAIRCAALILDEFEQVKPVLEEAGARTLADIGSGYGLFDLFAARDLGISCTLIDLESNENRHFGFADEGAAYSSLQVSKKLFEDNGLNCNTVNPTQVDVMGLTGPFDAVTSFLSCGFHYPTDQYLPFFENKIAPNGLLILDLRSKRAESELKKLEHIGNASDLRDDGSARRVLVRCA